MANRKLRSVLQAGIVAGTLDIFFAFAQYYIKTGKNPLIILKFIATGLFGKTALTGGNEMYVFGLLFHYLIAFAWTILFFAIYPKLGLFRKNILLSASIYGLMIWVIMNLVILPLSAAPSMKFQLMNAVTAWLILAVAIGLPVSLLAKKYYNSL